MGKSFKLIEYVDIFGKINFNFNFLLEKDIENFFFLFFESSSLYLYLLDFKLVLKNLINK